MSHAGFLPTQQIATLTHIVRSIRAWAFCKSFTDVRSQADEKLLLCPFSIVSSHLVSITVIEDGRDMLPIADVQRCKLLVCRSGNRLISGPCKSWCPQYTAGIRAERCHGTLLIGLHAKIDGHQIMGGGGVCVP